VTSGQGEIAFNWHTKFEGVVEIITTWFGSYYTGDTGSVMFPRKAKEKELMHPTVEEEMEFPILFDVRDGGKEMVVGYQPGRASNNWLKEKMEKGVAAGMKRVGIVLNESSTEWPLYPTTICDDCGREAPCLWLASKEKMILYNESLPEDIESNGRRHMIYQQMAFKMNGNTPLGRGDHVQLPKCVLAGVRSLFPSADGEYTGHRDARFTVKKQPIVGYRPLQLVDIME
jgi:hypothetical protein